MGRVFNKYRTSTPYGCRPSRINLESRVHTIPCSPPHMCASLHSHTITAHACARCENVSAPHSQHMLAHAVGLQHQGQRGKHCEDAICGPVESQKIFTPQLQHMHAHAVDLQHQRWRAKRYGAASSALGESQLPSAWIQRATC